MPKHNLHIISLDSNYGIESLIDPQMPAMGLNIDASGIDTKWDNKINCKIDMLINPAFAERIEFFKRLIASDKVSELYIDCFNDTVEIK